MSQQTGFYTSVVPDGNAILFRGFLNGKSVQRRIDYKPCLYVGTQKHSRWKSLEGYHLEERKFKDIWEAKSFIKKYEEVDNFKVYGMQRFQYACIADMFPEHIDFDPSKINTAIIDIEVDSTNGFPDVEKADSPITAITLFINGTYHLFGLNEYVPQGKDAQYHQASSEHELLDMFIEVWADPYPDILTGWNIDGFDIPYLVNRIGRLFGSERAFRLSPWGKVHQVHKKLQGRDLSVYDLVGINVLDYIGLYKKYAPNPSQESYSLDFISEVELGDHKLDYRAQGYKDLNDLYSRNFALYMDYNLRDVLLVKRIEDKLKLIYLAQVLAFYAKVNFDDVFSQGRMWDAILYNNLRSKWIAIPPNKDNVKKHAYEGAYVKDPEPGWYRWLVSFDLTSLYPHLIMMYNLGPETLVQPDDYDDEMRDFLTNNVVSVDALLDQKLDLSWMAAKNITLTPNGQFFRTDRQGFLGEIMQEMFDERAKYKKAELNEKQLAENAATQEKQQHKNNAARFKALQMALKVTLNSCYGSLGSAYFRFFDVRIAEAITLTGQLSIRWIQKQVNEYMNRILKTQDVDYILASDTDSIYINMKSLMDKLCPDQKDPKKVIALMNLICEEKIKPFIDESFEKLAKYVNAYDQKMIMKREALADQAIWAAKKNYVMSIYDNEGVVYEKPDVKITGWAAVRTDKPKLCRTKLKEAVALMLAGDLNVLRKFVSDFEKEFKSQPLVKIASPSGISELESYSDAKSVFEKGTPIHVKGALVFNHWIEKLGLEKKYERIRAKDKIKYINLKSPNPFQCNVIAFLDEIPAEFNLDTYIDLDAQFHKTFIQPLTIMLDAVKWKLVHEDTLEDFFV